MKSSAHHVIIEVLDETTLQIRVDSLQSPIHELSPVLRLEDVLTRRAHALRVPTGSRAAFKDQAGAGSFPSHTLFMRASDLGEAKDSRGKIDRARLAYITEGRANSLPQIFETRNA